MQEMARGFSLFEEALLVFEAEHLNVGRYTKVAATFRIWRLQESYSHH